MMRSNALFWLFLVGIACAELENLHLQSQFDGPFTDAVMKRLAILEDKELENVGRITALEEEVLDLRLRAKEDHQEILRLNRELELSNGRCENSKQRINKDQENNVSGGSDDPKENPVLRRLADELVIADTDKTVTTRPRQRRLTAEPEVAFSAAVSPHDVYHLGSNQPIKFDNAVLNVGNGYDSLTGVFIAPFDGIYSFTATIFGRLDNGVMYFGLCKNNVSCYANFEIKQSHQVAQSVILELHKGDHVAVLHNGNDHGIVGHNFTTFSGFLLYERFPAVQPVG